MGEGVCTLVCVMWIGGGVAGDADGEPVDGGEARDLPWERKQGTFTISHRHNQDGPFVSKMGYVCECMAAACMPCILHCSEQCAPSSAAGRRARPNEDFDSKLAGVGQTQQGVPCVAGVSCASHSQRDGLAVRTRLEPYSGLNSKKREPSATRAITSRQS